MNFLEKTRLLAATARVPNIPSVAGNVVTGIVIALAAGADPGADQACLLILTGISLYLAGNFLNDWADRSWDATQRPERALPRGVFKPALYLALAVAFALAGLGSSAAVNAGALLVATLIVVMITLYTALHKHTAWSVIPMGLCRALLPALGFAGCLPSLSGNRLFFIAPAALCACGFGLFCHIAGLSLSARNESKAHVSPGLILFARCLFPLAALAMLAASGGKFLNPALLIYGIWIVLCLTVFRKPVPRHVSNLLAGIPLLDWIVVLPLALAYQSIWSAGIADRMLMWFPPLAFIAGKLLQRLAPAT